MNLQRYPAPLPQLNQQQQYPVQPPINQQSRPTLDDVISTCNNMTDTVTRQIKGMIEVLSIVDQRLTDFEHRMISLEQRNQLIVSTIESKFNERETKHIRELNNHKNDIMKKYEGDIASNISRLNDLETRLIELKDISDTDKEPSKTTDIDVKGAKVKK